MDLVRLRTFEVLSETLHFGRAAERRGVTQSAVSARGGGGPAPGSPLRALRAGRLVRLRLGGFDARRTLWAIHHRDKRVTPPMRALVALLRARVGARAA